MIEISASSVKRLVTYICPAFDLENKGFIFRMVKELWFCEDGETWVEEPSAHDSKFKFVTITNGERINPATLEIWQPPVAQVGEVAPIPTPPAGYVPAFDFLISTTVHGLAAMVGALEEDFSIYAAIGSQLEKVVLMNPWLFGITGQSVGLAQ